VKLERFSCGRVTITCEIVRLGETLIIDFGFVFLRN
jgi:hypothetical protein